MIFAVVYFVGMVVLGMYICNDLWVPKWRRFWKWLSSKHRI